MRHTHRPRHGSILALALALTLTLAALALFASGNARAAAPAPRAPTAATGGTSNVSFSAATLYGSVNAEGSPTNYVFQYGTTPAYGAQSPLSAAGNATSTVKVSQAITGLQPVTLYHYRIVAFGSTSTTLGRDRTFATGKVPLSLSLVGTPNPVVLGAPFFIEGTLTGTGAANKPIALQANPFPYIAGFQTIGNPELTDAAGSFSFPYLGLLGNAELRVVTLGTPAVISPVVLETVAVKVSFHARKARHGYVHLYGTVTPAEPGALVGFQLLKPGHASINEGGTMVKPAGASSSKFSATVRIRHGLYRALVKVSADGAHVSGYSPPVVVR